MELTVTEKAVLNDLLYSTLSAIEYDKELKEYNVRDRTIFSCSKQEYLALKRISKKL